MTTADNEEICNISDDNNNDMFILPDLEEVQWRKCRRKSKSDNQRTMKVLRRKSGAVTPRMMVASWLLCFLAAWPLLMILDDEPCIRTRADYLVAVFYTKSRCLRCLIFPRKIVTGLKQSLRSICVQRNLVTRVFGSRQVMEIQLMSFNSPMLSLLERRIVSCPP